jgi:putative hydrolase of the HAD superfamily
MKVLMLDVDGVLVHEPPPELFARDAALDAAMAAVRFELTGEDWQALATGRADLLHRIEELLARLAISTEAQPLIDYWFASETHIDPVVLAAVRRLRATGTRVFLATNQEHRRARYLMETLELRAEVDGILHSAALGHRKPALDYFAAAAAKVGIRPDEAVFIDDNEGNVEAARLAGWRATHWLGETSLEVAIRAAR